jgi:hypothetical protein
MISVGHSKDSYDEITDRSLMLQAIDLARKSKNEQGKISQKLVLLLPVME